MKTAFTLKSKVLGVAWWPRGKEFGIFTAVAGVQSLAWEIPHATGTTPLPPIYRFLINIIFKINGYN